MRPAQRVYRALLRAYPARTRDARGDDMAQLFADQLRDAPTPLDQARVWVAAVADIAITAPREHVGWRRRMKVVDGPTVDAPRSNRREALVASTPMAIAAFLLLVRAPGYDVMFDSSVSVAGLPLGVFGMLMGAILAWIGIFASRRDDLGNPEVQVVLLTAALAPAPLVLLSAGLVGLAAYACSVTLFVFAMQVRLLMLALVVPFAVWLLVGPSVVLIIINLGGAGLNS